MLKNILLTFLFLKKEQMETLQKLTANYRFQMSESEILEESRVSAREICLSSVMAAFVFIATLALQILIPLGYAHLGDGAIFLAVFLCGRRWGLCRNFRLGAVNLAGGALSRAHRFR